MWLFGKIWGLLLPRQRVQAVLVLVGMEIAAVLEAMAVALVVPLVNIAGRADLAQEQPQVLSVFSFLNFKGGPDRWIVLALFIAGFYLLKNIFLAALTYFQFRFVYRSYASLSCRLLGAYLHAPWTFHLEKNTAELLRNTTSEVELVFANVLNPLIVLLTEVSVAAAIMVMLLLVDPMTSVAAIVLVGIFSTAFYATVRQGTSGRGKEQQVRRGNMIRWVNQALGGIKETKVSGCEGFFLECYAKNSVALARANTYLATISQSPRFVLESVVVAGVVMMLGITLARGQEGKALLPTLALFGAAAYRLMPSMTRIVGSVANVRYHRSAVAVVHADLTVLEEQERRAEVEPGAGNELAFERSIELRDVWCRYPGATQDSLSGISLVIPRGSSVALLGPSGAGKTTVVDVVLGLLEPTAGAVLVDGHDIREGLSRWQRKIGYIPQAVYLIDDSIRRNVAFGVPDDETEDSRVWASLEDAQLAEVVRGLPAGLDTEVGERGVRLSGGQRQRIGIARALYRQPEVLVMDEATSSVDTKTEKEINRAIERLSGTKTVIIVSHRSSTVEDCDLQYEIRPASLTRADGLRGLANG